MPVTNKFLFPLSIVFLEIAVYLSNDMYLPALPTIMQDFAVTAHQTQWTLTTFFFGAISVQLILGPLSDRYGRKLILQLGGILFLISTLLCATTHAFSILLLARFIQGSSICFISVPGYASIHESFDRVNAVRILALMGSITVLAPAFGPLLGSIVINFSNWRWTFWLLFIWSIVANILIKRWMPETLLPENRCAIQFTPALRRYFNIITNYRFITITFTFGLIFSGFIAWIAAGPFLVIDSFGYSAMLFSIFQAVIFSFFMLGNRLVKFFMDRMGIYKLIRIGLFTALIGGSFSLFFSIVFPDLLLLSRVFD